MADSDCATNVEDRKSVGGNVSTIGGCLTDWTSGTLKTSPLSASESELVSGTIEGQQLRFQSFLSWELGHVELPAILIVDDLGCTFLIRNPQVGKRTKHIDIRCRWMHDSWERLTLEAACVRGTENDADVLAKSAELKLFKPLELELREGILACWRENDKLASALCARKTRHSN